MQNFLNITVRVLPDGFELEIEIPLSTTARDLIESLLEETALGIRRRDAEGNAFSYKLTNKQSGTTLSENQTLADSGTGDGDTLLLMPELVAGGPGGFLDYRIPENIYIGEKGTCYLSIWDPTFYQKLTNWSPTGDNVRKIETGDVMKITLEENALNPKLHIKAVSEEQQIIEPGKRTNWQFEIFTVGLGKTSVLLKISKVVKWKKLGKHFKDVLILDLPIQVDFSRSNFYSGQSINHVEEIVDDSPSTLHDIRELVGNGQLQKALSMLVNIVQDKDKDLLNQAIMLQAQVADIENRQSIGILSQPDWTLFWNQINYRTLSFIDHLGDTESKAIAPTKRILDETVEWLNADYF